MNLEAEPKPLTDQATGPGPGAGSFSGGDIWADVQATRTAKGQGSGPIRAETGAPSVNDQTGPSGGGGSGGGSRGAGQAGGSESGKGAPGGAQGGPGGGGNIGGSDRNLPTMPQDNVDPGSAALARLSPQTVLPGLALADDVIPPGLIKDKSENWTVAIDLAASLPGKDANPIGAGVDHQLGELKALAKETEGTSVNIVVHAERPVDASWQPCFQENGNAKAMAACTTDATQNHMVSTERYFIHDGKIDQLPDMHIGAGGGGNRHSKPASTTPATLAPSQKLGLIVQSHGDGSHGIGTNLGFIDMDKTVQAVQAGLANSGHQNLDLLDFDSCDMAEAKVLEASRFAANDVVASSATEYATTTNDAQNLPAAMRSLFADSNMTGRQFGDAIVQQAQEGKNGQGYKDGTPTLANFDLTKYDQYSGALDKFGTALSAANEDPNNAMQLQNDIDRTKIPYPGFHGIDANDRDLKSFANNVLADAKNGKLKGDVQPLEAAATDLLSAYGNMETSSFGEKKRGYDNLGGMSVFLPGQEAMDFNTVVKSQSPLHQLKLNTSFPVNDIEDLSNKDSTVKMVQASINKLQPVLGEQYPEAINELTAANVAMAKTQNLDDYKAAYLHLQTVTKNLDDSAPGDLSQISAMRSQR